MRGHLSRFALAVVVSLVTIGLSSNARAALPVVDLDCGDDVDQSVALADDLTDCADDGLVVEASNITIDLRGHRITSNGMPDPGDEGIHLDEQDGVKIMNGEITGFYDGMFITDNIATTVQDMVVTGNTNNGIHFVDATDAKLKNNLVANNANFGFNLEFNGGTITGNEAFGNAFQGFNVEMSEELTVKGNHSNGNGDSGAQFAAAPDSLIQKNDFSGNENFGLFLANGDDVVVKKNRANGNENAGVFVVMGSPRIDKNTTNGNGYADGVGNGTGLGIDAGGATPTGSKNIARGNDNDDECDPPELCT